MPIIRNPFKKDHHADENSRPSVNGGAASGDGLEQTDVVGSKPLSIRLKSDNAPAEYKLSEINDSGVYLPPSPTEKKSFWASRSNLSSASRTSSHRSALNENEPFNISRESFDSYRRSFDISARSPAMEPDPHRPRQSLDARRLRLPTSATSPPLPSHPSPYLPTPVPPLPNKYMNPVEAQPEDQFEDVGLNDEVSKPKKRSFFPRFGDSTEAASAPVESSRPNSGYHVRDFLGRKRGQSGQGAELGAIPANTTPQLTVDN